MRFEKTKGGRDHCPAAPDRWLILVIASGMLPYFALATISCIWASSSAVQMPSAMHWS